MLGHSSRRRRRPCQSPTVTRQGRRSGKACQASNRYGATASARRQTLWRGRTPEGVVSTRPAHKSAGTWRMAPPQPPVVAAKLPPPADTSRTRHSRWWQGKPHAERGGASPPPRRRHACRRAAGGARSDGGATTCRRRRGDAPSPAGRAAPVWAPSGPGASRARARDAPVIGRRRDANRRRAVQGALGGGGRRLRRGPGGVGGPVVAVWAPPASASSPAMRSTVGGAPPTDRPWRRQTSGVATRLDFCSLHADELNDLLVLYRECIFCSAPRMLAGPQTTYLI